MENATTTEKLWTVTELKEKLGPRYLQIIMRMDVTLTRNNVYDALNGRLFNMESIRHVQALAQKAVDESEEVIRINTILRANRGPRKTRKNSTSPATN